MTTVKKTTQIVLCDQCKDEGVPDSVNARQKIASYVVNNGKTSRTVELCVRNHAKILDYLISLKPPRERYPILSKGQAKRR